MGSNGMYIKWFIGMVLLWVSFSSFAHKDARLKVDEHGIVSRIPAEFGEVKLNIEGLGSKKKVLTFSVNEQHTQVPECVANLIRTNSMQGVELGGSWYHETSILPYYVFVRFYIPAQVQAQNVQNPDLSLLFDLQSSQLLSVNYISLAETSVESICKQIQTDREQQAHKQTMLP